MRLSNSLPTLFAKTIALGVKLLPCSEKESHRMIAPYHDASDRLAAFQQLAISGTIADAMLAYHGEKLNKAQIAALELIYKTTKPWLMGHVVGEILHKIESDLQSGKDVTEQAKFILESFGTEGALDDKKKKQLLVRFAKVGEE